MDVEFPEIHHCKTKEAIFEQIQKTHEAIVNFYRSLPDDMLSSNAIPEGWSMKRNMKHVVGTNHFFAMFMSFPKFVFKLFGKPKSPQTPIEQLSPTNRPIIKDYGKYTKRDSFKTGEKEKILDSILKSSEKLKKAISKWSEEELDALSGPFFGMSLRTMAMFISKHNIHHTNVARSRIRGI